MGRYTSETVIVRVRLSALRAHPMNANAMDDERFEKLVGHIERTGKYPPLIVRPCPGAIGEPNAYQVLDGHHRWKALRRLRAKTADCVVWEADDTQACVLLTTLNRLQGSDDPRKRGLLLAELEERLGMERRQLAALVPETMEQVAKLLDAAGPMPMPAPPAELGDLPIAVTFFLSGDEKERLGTALERVGGTKEQALMAIVGRFESASDGVLR